MRSPALLIAILLLAGCRQAVQAVVWSGEPGSVEPNAAGLVSLPCDGSTPLVPTKAYYCREDRHFVRPGVRDRLIDAGRKFAGRYPGDVVRFMDASGADGITPFPPHFSHGDGRQIDLGLYYTDVAGQPMARFSGHIAPRRALARRTTAPQRADRMPRGTNRHSFQA